MGEPPLPKLLTLLTPVQAPLSVPLASLSSLPLRVVICVWYLGTSLTLALSLPWPW